MKRRLPPSVLLRASTAWAVVPEPAKESRTMSSGPHAIRQILSIKRVGFGLSNLARPTICSSSLLPSSVVPDSMCRQRSTGTRPAETSDRNFLSLGNLRPPSLPHQSSCSAICFRCCSSPNFQAFVGWLIFIPVMGLVIGYTRLGLCSRVAGFTYETSSKVRADRRRDSRKSHRTSHF